MLITHELPPSRAKKVLEFGSPHNTELTSQAESCLRRAPGDETRAELKSED